MGNHKSAWNAGISSGISDCAGSCWITETGISDFGDRRCDLAVFYEMGFIKRIFRGLIYDRRIKKYDWNG